MTALEGAIPAFYPSTAPSVCVVARCHASSEDPCVPSYPARSVLSVPCPSNLHRPSARVHIHRDYHCSSHALPYISLPHFGLPGRRQSASTKERAALAPPLARNCLRTVVDSRQTRFGYSLILCSAHLSRKITLVPSRPVFPGGGPLRLASLPTVDEMASTLQQWQSTVHPVNRPEVDSPVVDNTKEFNRPEVDSPVVDSPGDDSQEVDDSLVVARKRNPWRARYLQRNLRT